MNYFSPDNFNSIIKYTSFAPFVFLVILLNSCNNTIQLTDNKVNWNRGKLISYIEFDIDSVSEIYRRNYSFDEKGREISHSNYAYGNLLERRSLYSYTQYTCNYIDSIGNIKYFVVIDYLSNTNDYKTNTKTIYQEDHSTVYSLENYLYDNTRREIGYSITYPNKKNVLEYVNRNYTYTDKECIYSQDAYFNKELFRTLKYKVTFYDSSYNKDKLVSIIVYDSINDAELLKSTYTYDSLGRENGFKNYSEGVLVKEYYNYSYTDNQCTYYDKQTNIFPPIIGKRRIVFYKN